MLLLRHFRQPMCNSFHVGYCLESAIWFSTAATAAEYWILNLLAKTLKFIYIWWTTIEITILTLQHRNWFLVFRQQVILFSTWSGPPGAILSYCEVNFDKIIGICWSNVSVYVEQWYFWIQTFMLQTVPRS